MILAHAVYHPVRPEVVLLRPGAALDRHGIPRLAELGVHEVWIRYPGLETLLKFINPHMVDAYRSLIGQMGMTLDSAMVGSEADLDYHAFRTAMVNLLQQVGSSTRSAHLVSQIVRSSQPFKRHAGNTSFLSLLLGLRLDHYLISERSRVAAAAAKDVAALGVGAMFHDIGLLRIDPAALAAWSQHRDENDPVWKDHVKLGFSHVHEHLDAAAAAVVLHHHQRFDGSGFPKRTHLSGKEIPVAGSLIHIFARIASVADVFDRLHYPAYLPGETEVPAVPTVRVLKAMQSPPYTQWFDPVILEALHEVVAPFSPGSIVTLNDGRNVAVADWTCEDPCRPTVVPLRDITEATRHDHEVPLPIDLREHPELRIVFAEGEDVTGDLYARPTRQVVAGAA
jgi:HD-GYP domain-containing protein (c-di-GMP phosphodiesterase class II)